MNPWTVLTPQLDAASAQLERNAAAQRAALDVIADVVAACERAGAGPSDAVARAVEQLRESTRQIAVLAAELGSAAAQARAAAGDESVQSAAADGAHDGSVLQGGFRPERRRRVFTDN